MVPIGTAHIDIHTLRGDKQPTKVPAKRHLLPRRSSTQAGQVTDLNERSVSLGLFVRVNYDNGHNHKST